MANSLTFTNNWSTGLFECCEDSCSCCFGFCCCCCLACSISRKYGEKSYLPLFDIFSPAMFAGLGIPLFAPPAGLALRIGIRHRYGIKGTLCNDINTACFCMWCSWCQMHRELKIQQKKKTAVVNVQAEPVMVVPATPPPRDSRVGPSGVILASF